MNSRRFKRFIFFIIDVIILLLITLGVHLAELDFWHRSFDGNLFFYHKPGAELLFFAGLLLIAGSGIASTIYESKRSRLLSTQSFVFFGSLSALFLGLTLSISSAYHVLMKYGVENMFLIKIVWVNPHIFLSLIFFFVGLTTTLQLHNLLKSPLNFFGIRTKTYYETFSDSLTRISFFLLLFILIISILSMSYKILRYFEASQYYLSFFVLPAFYVSSLFFDPFLELLHESYNYFLLVIFFSWIWVPVWISRKEIFHPKLYRRFKDFSISEIDTFLDIFNQKFLLALSILLFCFIIGISYLRYPNLFSGVDSYWCLAALNQMDIKGVTVAFHYPIRPLFLLFLYSMKRIFFNNGFLVMKILPFIVGISLILCVYMFVKAATDNYCLASIAALLTPLSFSTIYHSNFTMTNGIGLALLLLFLSIFLKVANEDTKNSKIIATFLLIVLALSYMWAWIIASLILFFFILTLLLERNFSRLKNMILSFSKIYFLSFIIFIIVTIFIPSNIERLFQSIDYHISESELYTITGLSHLLNRGIFLEENIIILLFAIIGLVAICKLNSDFNRLILSWVISLTLFFLFFGWSWQGAFRISRSIPINILAGIGFYMILVFLKRYTMKTKLFHDKNLKLVKSFFIIVIVIFFQIAVNYQISISTYYVKNQANIVSNDSAVQDYEWIKNNIDNRELIICTTMKENVELFQIKGLAGGFVYPGHVLYLLQKQFDPESLKSVDLKREYLLLDDFGILENATSKKIILPEQGYQADFIEKQLTHKVQNRDLLIVRNLSDREIKYWASVWTKSKQISLAIVGGNEAKKVYEVIYQLGFNSTLYFGQECPLPNYEDLIDYDGIVLVDWNPPTILEVCKLIQYSRDGHTIIALSSSAHNIYNRSKATFELLFKSTEVDADHNAHIIYENQHYITMNLTKGYTKIGTSNYLSGLQGHEVEKLAYLQKNSSRIVLACYQNDNSRIIFYGNPIGNLSAEEYLVFYKSVYWSLGLEIPIHTYVPPLF